MARGLANEVVQVEQESQQLQDAIAALASRVKRVENSVVDTRHDPASDLVDLERGDAKEEGQR